MLLLSVQYWTLVPQYIYPVHFLFYFWDQLEIIEVQFLMLFLKNDFML